MRDMSNFCLMNFPVVRSMIIFLDSYINSKLIAIIGNTLIVSDFTFESCNNLQYRIFVMGHSTTNTKYRGIFCCFQHIKFTQFCRILELKVSVDKERNLIPFITNVGKNYSLFFPILEAQSFRGARFACMSSVSSTNIQATACATVRLRPQPCPGNAIAGPRRTIISLFCF